LKIKEINQENPENHFNLGIKLSFLGGGGKFMSNFDDNL
jgi:hypothetical protein